MERPMAVPVLLSVLRGGVPQEEFARAIGASRERYNAWERGRSEIGETYAARLSELTGLPVSRFVRSRDRELEALREQVELIVTQISEIKELLARAIVESPAVLFSGAVEALAQQPESQDPEQLRRLANALQAVGQETAHLAEVLERQPHHGSELPGHQAQ